jgi:hypothetical protein
MYNVQSISIGMFLEVFAGVTVLKVWHDEEWFIIQNIRTKEFWSAELISDGY